MVSVIVPAYNCIRSLEYCVRAVQQQTIADWELILVDDGSVDGSGALCDQYASEDRRIRAIHKPNGGVSSARNAGIETARGEHIVFCDSDDYLEPDYLEMLLQTAQKNPDYGHIWCCFQTVSGYKREDAVPNYTCREEILHFTLREYMTLHELWLDTGPCNKLFYTDIIRKHAVRFPEDISLGEDWLFNLDYIDASGNDKIVIVTKPLYNYVRGNSGSLDTRYRSDLLDIYHRLNAACLAHIKKWGAANDQMDKYYNSCFYTYEKVLSNTMRAPGLNCREKIHQNSMLMKSKEFQEALRKRTCFVHPLYLNAYRAGNYACVLCVNKLSAFRRAMNRMRQQNR